MNTDQVKGKLKQLTGEIKRKWGQLTDDDLREAQGSMEKLVGKIQERSGDKREEIGRADGVARVGNGNARICTRRINSRRDALRWPESEGSRLRHGCRCHRRLHRQQACGEGR